MGGDIVRHDPGSQDQHWVVLLGLGGSFGGAMKFLLPDEYQPAATHLFERVAEEVSRRVPDARIEHVGASAVPGAFSKGDLDICYRDTKAAFIEGVLASH